jgi:hypothetical protein
MTHKNLKQSNKFSILLLKFQQLKSQSQQMPEQIKRLLIFAVFIGVIFIAFRILLKPKSFGEMGHYRALAIDTVISHPIKYAGHQICSECHEEIAFAKQKSYHREVNCETCHGPAQVHIDSGAEILPDIPRGRDHCALCHEYNPARPTGFPQIDLVAHNPLKACVSCHNPHTPDPLRIPDDCSACHGNISRTKALSPHALLECTVCHYTPDEHKKQPRKVEAMIPATRADCAKCHDKLAIVQILNPPRIDLNTHGENYLCWQCHYPHFPESK